MFLGYTVLQTFYGYNLWHKYYYYPWKIVLSFYNSAFRSMYLVANIAALVTWNIIFAVQDVTVASR
jgi:hypothetical protein